MGIALQDLLSCVPASCVSKQARLWPALTIAKGCLWGLWISGSLRRLHLVELREHSRLFSPATQETNWVPQDQMCPMQGWEVFWVNFSSCLFEIICFTSQLLLRTRISHCNLLFRIFYRTYFLCFLLHTLPFTKKYFSSSLLSFSRITLFPLWFKNVLRFLSAFEMCFCKSPYSFP